MYRPAAIVALALLAGACSTVELAYDRADWLLLKQMDEYLDLDDAQETVAREYLRERMATHRREELPGYVQTLGTVRAMSRDGLDGREVDWIFDATRNHLRTAVDRTIPAVAAVLADMDDTQIAHLSERIAKANEEFRERHLEGSAQQRRAARTQRLVKGLKRWTGKLREEQVRLVDEMQTRIPDGAAQWLTYRERRQRELLALLRSGADAGRISAQLRAWWIHLAGRGETLERLNEAQTEGWKNLVLALDGTLSPEQRTRVDERLGKLIAEMRRIVA